MTSHVARLGRWWYVFRRTASDVAILKRAASPRLDSNSDYRESNKASSLLFIIIAIRGHLQHPSPPTPDLRRRGPHKSLSAGLAIIYCNFLAYQIITLLRKMSSQNANPRSLFDWCSRRTRHSCCSPPRQRWRSQSPLPDARCQFSTGKSSLRS